MGVHLNCSGRIRLNPSKNSNKVRLTWGFILNTTRFLNLEIRNGACRHFTNSWDILNYCLVKRKLLTRTYTTILYHVISFSFDIDQNANLLSINFRTLRKRFQWDSVIQSYFQILDIAVNDIIVICLLLLCHNCMGYVILCTLLLAKYSQQETLWF